VAEIYVALPKVQSVAIQVITFVKQCISEYPRTPTEQVFSKREKKGCAGDISTGAE
jgi:hypothetical protein